MSFGIQLRMNSNNCEKLLLKINRFHLVKMEAYVNTAYLLTQAQQNLQLTIKQISRIVRKFSCMEVQQPRN